MESLSSYNVQTQKLTRIPKNDTTLKKERCRFAMSIEMQKKIKFIPFLNFLLIGIQWLKAFRNGLPIKRLFLTLFIVWLIGVITLLPQIIIESFWSISPQIKTILTYIYSYVVMFAFSCRAIYDQKNI